mgnify:CR=1 FL=1
MTIGVVGVSIVVGSTVNVGAVTGSASSTVFAFCVSAETAPSASVFWVDGAGSLGPFAVTGTEVVPAVVVGDEAAVSSLRGNLKPLSTSVNGALLESYAHLSSFPSASGFGLRGRTGSTGSVGRLLSRLLLRSAEITGKLPSLLLVLSSELPRLGPPPELGPVMLILAIVSGLGDLRISSGRSSVGDDGTEDVKGSEARLSGSGRLKGAGTAEATTSGGGAGRR